MPRVAAGDPGAAGELMQTYGNLVWSVARRMLGHGAETEDAVQDVFIELWKHAGRFDAAKGNEAAFVTTIARRRVVDRVRSRQRRPDTDPLPETYEPAEEATADPAEQSDEVARATAALESLPEPRQAVLRMALMAGTTHTEIAQQTGLPLGTVKTHVRRGLIRMREMLGESER
ncbi:MAG: RNA polymerase sigma factor [Planctomycetota bacterium]